MIDLTGMSISNNRSATKRRKGAVSEDNYPFEAPRRAAAQKNSNYNHHNRKQPSRKNHPSDLVLWWPSAEPHVPLTVEEDMMTVILRWGAKERGMLKDQPPFRFNAIQQRCQRNRFRLSQACSLRRHHMQKLNPFKTKEFLQLGKTKDIRVAAALFEQAMAQFLNTNRIAYYSEDEQKAQHKRDNPGEPQRGTPDFMMKEPVLLKVYSNNNNNNNRRNNNKRSIQEERTIYWIEAKMFYGASTIPVDGKSAVGSILPKMKKYVKAYGPGAIVFSQGCGAKLAQELDEIGVTALNCFSQPEFDLSQVQRQQRTWCGDKKGNILP